jgi:hypothetical protein
LGSVLSAPLLRGVAAPSSEWQLSRSQRLSEKQFAQVLLPTSSPIPANPPCILRLDANRHGCVPLNLEAQCKRLGQHASEYYGAFATAYFYSFAGCTNIGLFAMCGLLSQSESGAGGPPLVIFCGIISIEGAPSLRSWQGRLRFCFVERDFRSSQNRCREGRIPPTPAKCDGWCSLIRGGARVGQPPDVIRGTRPT